MSARPPTSHHLSAHAFPVPQSSATLHTLDHPPSHSLQSWPTPSQRQNDQHRLEGPPRQQEGRANPHSKRVKGQPNRKGHLQTRKGRFNHHTEKVNPCPRARRAHLQSNHLIAVAVSVAEQLDGERKQPNILLGDVIIVSNDALNFIADGRTFFSETDLRRAFAHQRLVLTSHEVNGAL